MLVPAPSVLLHAGVRYRVADVIVCQGVFAALANMSRRANSSGERKTWKEEVGARSRGAWSVSVRRSVGEIGVLHLMDLAGLCGLNGWMQEDLALGL